MDNRIHDIVLKFSQQVKKLLGQKLDKVILYGSYARGDYNEHSDIDIMILTTLTDEEIENAFATYHDVLAKETGQDEPLSCFDFVEK